MRAQRAQTSIVLIVCGGWCHALFPYFMRNSFGARNPDNNCRDKVERNKFSNIASDLFSCRHNRMVDCDFCDTLHSRRTATNANFIFTMSRFTIDKFPRALIWNELATLQSTNRRADMIYSIKRTDTTVPLRGTFFCWHVRWIHSFRATLHGNHEGCNEVYTVLQPIFREYSRCAHFDYVHHNSFICAAWLIQLHLAI